MRRKRAITENAFYHVTSRTNDKIRVFENKLGRKIMLMVLLDAKAKFHFRLANFCVMPTHIHLLIEPGEGTNLSMIMQWIKTKSAKWWNNVHGSTDHVWGNRFFSRAIRDPLEFEFVMNYIDQNPVVVGLSNTPEEWKASGAFYKARNIQGLVDFNSRTSDIKLISPIPFIVSKLIPQSQLSNILRYYGIYAENIDRLYALVPTIPRLGESAFLRKPPICLHYFNETIKYFIYEYDGDDTFYGIIRSSIFQEVNEFRNFSLKKIKSNENLKLDLSWEV